MCVKCLELSFAQAKTQEDQLDLSSYYEFIDDGSVQPPPQGCAEWNQKIQEIVESAHRIHRGLPLGIYWALNTAGHLESLDIVYRYLGLNEPAPTDWISTGSQAVQKNQDGLISH